ncbi:MAG: glycosyltransferase, partial [Planctomycetes bacterium]|nr:glycosyltransferase [Planctomycetota bacterium]
FVPPIEQIVSASDAFKSLFRDIDVFIQPWRSEHWRPELLEAMSVGNAIIVTESPGNDLIIDGQTASVVPFQDESALKTTLDRMLQDHQYARNLATKAQKHLRKHFLASRMIARLAKTYQQVVNPGKL